MSTYRTVHNPSALVDAEVKLVDDQLTNMRERGVSHRTDAPPGQKWPMCGRPLFTKTVAYLDADDVLLEGTCPECLKALDDLEVQS